MIPTGYNSKLLTISNINNDGSIKYRLSGNILSCNNYGNILKLSK